MPKAGLMGKDEMIRKVDFAQHCLRTGENTTEAHQELDELKNRIKRLLIQ